MSAREKAKEKDKDKDRDTGASGKWLRKLSRRRMRPVRIHVLTVPSGLFSLAAISL